MKVDLIAVYQAQLPNDLKNLRRGQNIMTRSTCRIFGLMAMAECSGIEISYQMSWQ